MKKNKDKIPSTTSPNLNCKQKMIEKWLMEFIIFIIFHIPFLLQSNFLMKNNKNIRNLNAKGISSLHLIFISHTINSLKEKWEMQKMRIEKMTYKQQRNQKLLNKKFHKMKEISLLSLSSSPGHLFFIFLFQRPGEPII